MIESPVPSLRVFGAACFWVKMGVGLMYKPERRTPGNTPDHCRRT